jgi:alkylhydroperoxidase/carboxymuconolactone decarboxylase family protein YurZ
MDRRHQEPTNVADRQLTELIDYRMTLRDLTIRADAFIDGVLSSENVNMSSSKLEPRTHALVRLAALVAMGAAEPSYRQVVEAARDAGASAEEVVGTLVAVITATGVPRVVAAAPAVGLALGYDVQAALESPDPHGVSGSGPT